MKNLLKSWVRVKNSFTQEDEYNLPNIVHVNDKINFTQALRLSNKNIADHFYQSKQTRFYKLSYNINRRKFCVL